MLSKRKYFVREVEKEMGSKMDEFHNKRVWKRWVVVYKMVYGLILFI